MTRYYYNLVSLSLQVSILVFVGCSPTDGSESLSMSDRLQQLTEDFGNYQVNTKEVLATKDVRLVTLDLKIEQVEEMIVSLQQKINERQAVSVRSKSVLIRSADRNDNNKNPEVSPVMANTGMPKSCADLKNMGHTLNGLYLVMGTEHVQNVYCNFLAFPSDSSFQTWIGHVDVKSLPVYFYVQRDTHIDAINYPKEPIPFEIENLNNGNAMDSESGKFTAPRPGIYYFSFSALVCLSPSYSSYSFDPRSISVGIFLNGNQYATGYADEVSFKSQFETLSFQSTLILKAGDQIWLEIVSNSKDTYLYNSFNNHSTHFSGWLLEEKISI